MAAPWEGGWRAAQPAVESAARAILSRGSGGGTSSLPVQRINLIEAAVLDGEILHLLEGTFAAAVFGTRAAEQGDGADSASFASTSSSSVSVLFSQRKLMSVLLRGVVLSATVLSNRPTPGQALQNVRYRNERKFRDPRTAGLLSLPGDSPTAFQRAAWVMLNVVVPYAWPYVRHKLVLWVGRWFRGIEQAGPRDGSVVEAGMCGDQDPEMPTETRIPPASSFSTNMLLALRSCTQYFCGTSAPEVAVGRALDVVEAIWGLASLTNLVVFMRHGVYATLINRLLRMRQVPTRAAGSRTLNFDYQNRQLVFSELNDFAMYVLPMLRVYSTLRATRRYAARGKARLQRLGRHMGWLKDVGSSVTEASTAKRSLKENCGRVDAKGDPLVMAPEIVEACAWCDSAPAQTPFVVSCGCTLCYYCLRTRVDPVLVKKKHGKEYRDLGSEAVQAACPSCGQHVRWSQRWEDFYHQACESQE